MNVTPSTRAAPVVPPVVTPVTEAAVIAAFARREHAGRALADDVERVVRAARDMAARFHLGGKLIVFGSDGAGADAAHIAVEFMHPVIVGKRALAAVALNGDVTASGGAGSGEGREDGRGGAGGGNHDGDAGIFAHRVRHWADASDMALGISRDGRCPNVLRGLEAAGELGLLTIALTGGGNGDGAGTFDRTARGGNGNGTTWDGNVTARGGSGTAGGGSGASGGRVADHVLIAASDDPAVVKEVHVTAYHLLWELVHVFFDRLGPSRELTEGVAR